MGFWNFENEMEELADRKQKAVSTSLNIGLCPLSLHLHPLNTVPYSHNVYLLRTFYLRLWGTLNKKI